MQFNSRVTSFKQYPFAILAAKRKALLDAGRKVYDFSKGDPVEPTPAFIRAAVGKTVPEVSQYPAVKGLPELRGAIAKYAQRRFGVTLDPESQILQCNGSKEAIYNLTSVVIGPESERKVVISASPSYPVVERSTIIFSGELHSIPLTENNHYLIDLAEVPESILKRTAIVWLNYPNNPTAASCSLEYLQRQIEIAKRYDILVCSDECYVDMYLGDRPHPSALQVSTEGVVVFQSCSKRSGMTGYRTGFIAGDKTLLKHYLSLRDAIGTETSIFVQQAAIAAWNDDQHVAERKAIFLEKRDFFLKFFAAEGLSWAPCDATFYIWLKTPKGLSGMEYSEALLKEGIIVTPGEYFGPGCEDRVRVALVPSIQQSQEAVTLWKKCHSQLK
ncbi:MAG: aminotransferase class I/II-fold pyridoxal phosphate-dependent enzyme [Deltaproteobacteria bacterium]|nr:aminotransferase class I/II-fold pyridoxal phosphate-dependent enzyme [Deltaproteobacteria bacterium]